MDSPVARQHKTLSVERWRDLTVCEQMANIGSDVIRALKWREKGHQDYSHKAFCRALELVDLSLKTAARYPQIREFARLREALVDYFCYSNQYQSSAELWLNYFNHFNYAARNRE